MGKATVWISVCLTVVVGVTWFMFRVRSVDAGDKGVLRARYQWGQLRVIEYDANRDGAVDGKDWLGKGAILAHPETWKPTVSTRDVDFDGTSDIEWVMHSRKGVVGHLYWIDSNVDGQLDTILCGEEGREYLSRLLSERETRIVEAAHRAP